MELAHRYRALLERYAGIFTAAPSEPPDDALPGLLDECLDALPAADRALLDAKYHDRQPTAALANAADCSEKAIESRLARLRQREPGHWRYRGWTKGPAP